MQAIEVINRAIFLAINATPRTPHGLIAMGIFIANDAILLAPIVLVCLWLMGGDERRELALRAFAAGFLALGINQLIGLVWYHPRPFVIGLGHTFLPHAPDSSFPSDHATLLSALAFTFLAAGKRQLGFFVLIVDLAVAWARVFIGVHFPFDMLGAALIAGFACVAVKPLWTAGGAFVTRASITLYRKLLALPIKRGWLRP